MPKITDVDLMFRNLVLPDRQSRMARHLSIRISTYLLVYVGQMGAFICADDTFHGRN